MAPLPHYNSNMTYQSTDPIYKNLFDIKYSSSYLTTKECELLTTNSHRIEKNILHLNINEDSLNIFHILQKMKKFTLTVLSHSRDGKVLFKFVYSDCEFVNLLESMVDFDWNQSDILRLRLELKYKKIEYIDSQNIKNHDRAKKIERIFN